MLLEKSKTQTRIELFKATLASIHSAGVYDEGRYVQSESLLQTYGDDFRSGRFVVLVPGFYYVAQRDADWASMPGGARHAQSCFTCSGKIAKGDEVYDFSPNLAPTFRICRQCRLKPPPFSRLRGWDRYTPTDPAATTVREIIERPFESSGTNRRKDAAVAVDQLHDKFNEDQTYALVSAEDYLIVPKRRLRLLGSNTRSRDCNECGEMVRKGEPVYVPIDPAAPEALCEGCFNHSVIAG